MRINHSKLCPPADHTGSIPKVIAPPEVTATQVEIGIAMGKYVATKVSEVVANSPAIEVIHIVTHSGGEPSKECNVGVFNNRGGYFSALKRTCVVDNYKKSVVPVDCHVGLISFEAEAVATELMLKSIPFIKSVDDLTSLDSWSTVLANKRLRVGTHSSTTKLFVSFGHGRLKGSLAKGAIQVNAIGKVPVLKPVSIECKPHKKHTPFQCPSKTL